MAALCPRCGTELPPDPGLALCPSCGTPSFLDANGELQASSSREAELPDESPIHFSPPGLADNESPAPDFNIFGNDSLPPFETPTIEITHAAPSQNEIIDISEYANSEFSQGKNGAFVYNVSISDIDSKEIRDFLREAINDSRFGWDSSAIISQIKKGELLLKNLSPVKASILITRIKHLPVKIRWEQYAITQAEQGF